MQKKPKDRTQHIKLSKPRTPNGKLYNEGFRGVAIVPRKPYRSFRKRLSQELNELNKLKIEGRILEIRVVPGEEALKGYERRLEQPSDIVYARPNTKHPDYDSTDPIFLRSTLGTFVREVIKGGKDEWWSMVCLNEIY